MSMISILMDFRPAAGQLRAAAMTAFVLTGVPAAAQSTLSAPAAVQQPAGSIPTGAKSAVAGQVADYIVGPNDVLSVNVFDRPELTGKFLVQADGTITYPLLERVKVGGLTMQQVENTLRDQLGKRYLRNPQVGVTVEQYRSQQIFVMGEVRSPGTLEFTGSMTFIAALARAGSVTERAAHEALIIRPPAGAGPVVDAAALARAQQGGSDLIRVDLQSLQAGALSQNVVLHAGDTIFVPKVDTVFISGHVGSPGEYPIRKGMTVRQVLSLAGGVTDRGSSRRIQILRKVDGKDRTVDVREDDVVQPNDTIVVRERFF